MKRLALFVCFAAGAASAADLATVQKVYLLRMSKGFDQHLANHLTRDKVFQVVTDPKLADTIITDRIGLGFQARLDELFPPPEAPKPEKPAKEKEPEEQDSSATLMTDTVNKLANPASSSSFGGASGMVFLVDTKSKQVIWSMYELPKDSSSRQMDRTASDVVDRIKKDLGRK